MWYVSLSKTGDKKHAGTDKSENRGQSQYPGSGCRELHAVTTATDPGVACTVVAYTYSIATELSRLIQLVELAVLIV